MTERMQDSYCFPMTTKYDFKIIYGFMLSTLSFLTLPQITVYCTQYWHICNICFTKKQSTKNLGILSLHANKKTSLIKLNYNSRY